MSEACQLFLVPSRSSNTPLYPSKCCELGSVLQLLLVPLLLGLTFESFKELGVRQGVTTDEIDKEVHKMIIDAGEYPSPLGYGGFLKSVCIFVNECICHGIPESRPLQVHSSFSIICVALFVSKILHGLQVECCVLGFKLKLNFLLDCCLMWAYS